MQYLKCIKIDKENNIYILKDGDNNEYRLEKKELRERVYCYDMKVINLNKNFKLDAVSGYKNTYMLSSSYISDKTRNTYNKSLLLGTNPDTFNRDDLTVCKKGKYDELWLTDCTRIIEGNIKANKIIFVGSQSINIDSFDNYGECNIFVKKAIIKNHAIVGNFNGRLDYHGGIKIFANEIDIKHKFIDENTVFEMFLIIHSNLYNSGNEEYQLSVVNTHFDYVDIDYETLLNNIVEMKESIWEYVHKCEIKVKTQIKDYKHESKNYRYTMTAPKLQDLVEFLEEYSILLKSLCISLPKYKFKILEGLRNEMYYIDKTTKKYSDYLTPMCKQYYEHVKNNFKELEQA